MKSTLIPLILFAIIISSCSDSGSDNDKEMTGQEAATNDFQADRQFLEKWDSTLFVLASEDGKSRIIVSPKYQGKVFTSTAGGESGKSLGWINYGFFEKDQDPHMNAYGGEDRLWLGPEGGPFSLFFAPGTEQVFENWRTPPPIDTEAWETETSSNTKVSMRKSMNLQNYAGTQLNMMITRDVEIMEPASIGQALGVDVPASVQTVGYRTTNSLTNAGQKAWDRQTGAPCMWNLGMFVPTPQTTIVIPYDSTCTGKIATTDYFGEIPSDRIKMESGILYFKADGKSRGKLGIAPCGARPVAGSYAPDGGVLTITMFDVDRGATYLNQEWTTSKDPFTGDAMNAYNDGPLEDGSQMGPFYEIESVSPAAFLKPGEKLTHVHSVFHFTGDLSALDTISKKVLGVSLEQIQNAFPKNQNK